MLKKKGLTLIEMLAVIAIIAILFVLLVPQINIAITKAREAGIITDFGSYRTAGMMAVHEGNDLTEEEFNKMLDTNLRFQGGKSKKETPFKNNYYLYVTTEGYTIVTERKGKTYTLTINKEGETTNSFENGEDILGGGIISKPNDPKAPSLESNPNDFEYIDVSQNEISIYAYKGTRTNVIIPSEIDEKRVVAISPNAFENATTYINFGRGNVRLKSIVIPEGVRTIGYDSFSNNDLVSVTIPSTVDDMQSSPFGKNPNAKFYISENNQHYKTDENNAGIYSKDGKTIYMGTKGVFSTEIYKTVENIAIYSFWGNEPDMVFIPSTAKDINHMAFMDNTNLKFNVEEGNPIVMHGENNEGLYSKNLTHIYAGSKDTFNTSTYRNITGISGIAFYGAKLDYAYIPKNVKTIEGFTFKNNPNIKFEVDAQNTEFAAGEGGYGLYTKDKKEIVTGTQSVFGTNDFNNVEIIGLAAFYEMGLKGDITIPNKVKRIESDSMALNFITKVTLPSSMEYMEPHAFHGNYDLEEVKNNSNLDLKEHFYDWIKIN